MKEVYRFFKSTILIIAITAFLMNYIFINAYVPTGSMENTIMAGDRIFGIRFSHGYRRGQIVIFPDTSGSGLYLVKRIIGIPGDTVEIDSGKVWINGDLLNENYLKEPMEPEESFTIILPEDGYFVMGDNRNDSYDARYWENKVVYGKTIVGVVLFRYWPIMEMKYLAG